MINETTGRKFWRRVCLLATIVAGTGTAAAADLDVKAPVYKAAPVIISDWAGFYLGIHGGYGWGDTKFDGGFDNYLITTDLRSSSKGTLFGGHAGYNWQYGSVVTGLEVDFDGADIKGSASQRVIGAGGYLMATKSSKFDELATTRARLGYLVLPDLLAYGTAGLGWGHSTVNEVLVESVDRPFEGHASNFGWVAGAGLEYKLWGSNFIARAEYLHYDFGKTTYTVGPDTVDAKSSIEVVRGGLSYKF